MLNKYKKVSCQMELVQKLDQLTETIEKMIVSTRMESTVASVREQIELLTEYFAADSPQQFERKNIILTNENASMIEEIRRMNDETQHNLGDVEKANLTQKKLNEAQQANVAKIAELDTIKKQLKNLLKSTTAEKMQLQQKMESLQTKLAEMEFILSKKSEE
jgi:hypothetical protein